MSNRQPSHIKTMDQSKTYVKKKGIKKYFAAVIYSTTPSTREVADYVPVFLSVSYEVEVEIIIIRQLVHLTTQISRPVLGLVRVI